jgi:transcriptional regulator with XRE-family HTH domain
LSHQADLLDITIGDRILGLRRQRNLSLQQVAEVAGISIGHLSQIERGLSSPAVRDLIRIAEALGARPGFFFEVASEEAPSDHDIVVRTSNRREVVFHEGITKEALFPPGEGAILTYMITIRPGGRAGEQLYTHSGEEAGVVIQGQLLLTVEDRDFTLNEGDSFRFVSSRPHRFSNPTKSTTRVVWINVPGRQ